MNGFIILAMLSLCTCQLMVHPEGSQKCLVDKDLNVELIRMKCEQRKLVERMRILEQSLEQERKTRAGSAFYARGISIDRSLKDYAGVKLVFGKSAVRNRDGSYNTTTGVYSCPVSGYYFFTYTIFANQQKTGIPLVAMILYKSGKRKTTAYRANRGSEPLDITLSQAVTLHCNTGEEVWVANGYSHIGIFGISHLNLFSGILLNAD